MYYKIEQLKNILANHKNCVFSLDHLCSSALEYIQHLEAGIDRCYELAKQVESAQPKWISVDADQKPQHGKEYLCVCSLPDDPKREWDWIMVLRWYAYGTNGYVDRPHFTDEGLNGMIVTHWMELPKRPKEEK
jgi:hypothetical protein